MFPIRDHNPSERIPYVTYVLIAINIVIWGWGAVFVTTNAQVNSLYLHYAMIPILITEGENYSSLITSTFLHAGPLHLAGNMLFLFIFGDNLEDEMGHLPYLLFYLACGAAADLAQWAADPMSAVPTVGASGAIAGVMGGYLLLFPKAKVDIFAFFVVFFRIFPVPAWIMLGLWFGLQLFNSIGSDTAGGGVAYWAHSGGFVIGMIFTLPLWLRRGAVGFWDKTHGHPPHPAAKYPIQNTRIPKVRRK